MIRLSPKTIAKNSIFQNLGTWIGFDPTLHSIGGMFSGQTKGPPSKTSVSL